MVNTASSWRLIFLTVIAFSIVKKNNFKAIAAENNNRCRRHRRRSFLGNKNISRAPPTQTGAHDADILFISFIFYFKANNFAFWQQQLWFLARVFRVKPSSVYGFPLSVFKAPGCSRKNGTFTNPN